MPGVYGHTGSLSGLELLEILEKLECSGTLVLEHSGKSLFISLNGGRLETSHKLGQFNALDTNALEFHFEPHAPDELPLFKSRFPTSRWGIMRAVPALGCFSRVRAQPDLAGLLAQLCEEGFSGCLSAETRLGQGLILFYKGQVGAAFSEEDELVREATDALRALRRMYQEPGAALYVRTLAPFFVTSLLGMAQQQTTELGVGFSGLESSEQGYTFYHQGQPVLRVRAELCGASGCFTQLDTPPELTLPDEPPGWELQRYGLTLRGKDALNPMTELSSGFKKDFGSIGRRVLEHLEEDLPLDSVAKHVNLELGDFKTYLDKLEQAGLIRQRHP